MPLPPLLQTSSSYSTVSALGKRERDSDHHEKQGNPQQRAIIALTTKVGRLVGELTSRATELLNRLAKDTKTLFEIECDMHGDAHERCKTPGYLHNTDCTFAMSVYGGNMHQQLQSSSNEHIIRGPAVSDVVLTFMEMLNKIDLHTPAEYQHSDMESLQTYLRSHDHDLSKVDKKHLIDLLDVGERTKILKQIELEYKDRVLKALPSIKQGLEELMALDQTMQTSIARFLDGSCPIEATQQIIGQGRPRPLPSLSRVMCVAPAPVPTIPMAAVRTAPFEARTAPGNFLQGEIKNQT